MFDEKVLYPTQFPVEERNRKSTDVCCTIISAILPIVMFIVALSMWNRGKFYVYQGNFDSKFFGFNQTGSGATCKAN